jgi:hypothetical protein
LSRQICSFVAARERVARVAKRRAKKGSCIFALDWEFESGLSDNLRSVVVDDLVWSWSGLVFCYGYTW